LVTGTVQPSLRPQSTVGPGAGHAMVGVLALQGAFARHVEAVAGLGYESFEVRNAAQLERCDALVLPGGESTTMSNLLKTFDLVDPLTTMLAGGLPVFGTCAGMILLADSISDGREDQISFGVIDIAVRRNGYGRQIDSFETDLAVAELGDDPFTAVFIRAPVVEAVGAGVDVLASVDGDPVLCRQGPILVSSFHPELTEDLRLHRYFLTEVAALSRSSRS
jgi:5'-phosphate synthase pdxT subunit